MAKNKQSELHIACICIGDQMLNMNEASKSEVKEAMDRLFEEKKKELTRYIISRPETQEFLRGSCPDSETALKGGGKNES